MATSLATTAARPPLPTLCLTVGSYPRVIIFRAYNHNQASHLYKFFSNTKAFKMPDISYQDVSQ